MLFSLIFFFSSRRRHTRCYRDWSSDVCSSDLLQAVVQENLSKRSTEAAQAEHIVTDEVSRFIAWMNSRGAVPTVVALRQRFEAIRQSELKRLEPKLAGLSPEARA